MDLTRADLIDLTHTLSEDIPTWNGSCGFCSEITLDYDKGLRVQKLSLYAGLGTHMDAPSHFYQGAEDIDEIPLEKLIAPLCKIDITAKCSENSCLEVEDVLAFEKAFGRLEKGDFVAVHTGWDRFWKSKEQYRNRGKEGKMRFPTIAKEAAALMLERGCSGIGIDTLSPDPEGSDFPVHHLFLGAGAFIVENIAHLAKLPPKGAYGILFPLKAKGVTEAPIRFVAFLEKGR